MKKKKILDEGLLELYLLDELPQETRAAVEQAIQEDGDLRSHFEQLERDFEQMAFENAITPDARVKENLKERLEPTKIRSLKWASLWAAASLAFLFLASSIWFYNKWQTSQESLDQLQQQTTVIQERLNVLETDYLTTNKKLRTINGPKTIPLILHGNELVPNSRAVAYVNHESKMVVVNAQGLPALPKDKTYQMWSDVEGEMINMGLLSTDKDLVTLKYIDKAESLNITIEPAGGNDHPTVEQLISAVTL